jgi:methylglyoxal synthase
MDRRPSIALIAHDAKKSEMAKRAEAHVEQLEGCALTSTGTTGSHLMQRCPSLTIEHLLNGPAGGDQQIGARIVEGRIDVLVFLIDPFSAQPHDVDVKALVGVVAQANIRFAINRRTADPILATLLPASPL